MIRAIRWLCNYLKYANSRHPSWRVLYSDGTKSWPLTRDDAVSRARIFGPARVVYCRDYKGDLQLDS